MLERVAKQLLAVRRPGRPPTTSLPSLRGTKSKGRRSYPAAHARRCAQLVDRIEASLASTTTPRVRGVALVIATCFYDGRARAVSQAHMRERVWDRTGVATSRGTIQRALAALEAAQWIERAPYVRGSLAVREYLPTARMLDTLAGEQLTLAPEVYAAAARAAEQLRSGSTLGTHRQSTPSHLASTVRAQCGPRAETPRRTPRDAERPPETPKPTEPKAYSVDISVLRVWKPPTDRRDGDSSEPTEPENSDT